MNPNLFSFAGLLLLSLCAVLPLVAQDQELKAVTARPGQPPSDAIVLFDGKNLDQWENQRGGPANWNIFEGWYMSVGEGGIVTRQEFGDFQLHVEFAAQFPPVGEGQNRGNSGVYLQGIYELQVLDSYRNPTYADGQAGAIYKQHIPLVNSSRAPGEWQCYDIVFHAPKFDASGNRTAQATLTVLHNGVLVQDHVLLEATPGGVREKEAAKGPIFLQDHNCPVRFRNIWIREL